MKSRSSTGVGMKVDLEYNIESMRITDDGGEDGDSGNSYRPQSSSSDIMSRLKTSSSVTTVDDSMGGVDNKKVVGDVQGSKLKSMLRDIQKNNI